MNTSRFGIVTALAVPYKEKEIAKEAGARWYSATKQWVWLQSDGELPKSLQKYAVPEPRDVMWSGSTEHRLGDELIYASWVVVIGDEENPLAAGKLIGDLHFVKFPFKMFIFSFYKILTKTVKADYGSEAFDAELNAYQTHCAALLQKAGDIPKDGDIRKARQQLAELE